MSPEDRDRYVRWQDHRVTQLSFSVNLFLGFAVASLTYAINLKLEVKSHASIPLESVIVWWGTSAVFGAIATISKLLDYRYTAKKIKNGGRFNTVMANVFGPITWGAFWVQIAAYSWGAYLFIKGVLSA